ncbi:PspC domain-containing protein [Kordiimonas sp. SCSIO 12603]|uniref:PspC domain-containing protein n=1 Tax=Kordiimonas sp. SCSIO 12603 TaxID=2829596 RepID=UPI0021069615|nr:PspC domain-containing protein [Kordiimonas sp. SCSIO 12603]UTW60251.1 PspC domain-containing protein [Kordiimonas sp. SCSIO 12603]
MNKVVSIEIAGQVFWIDEEAYDVLRSYLKKIRHQLAGDDCEAEIVKDIELRIAELLYTFSSHDKKAITVEQLESVIEQVGFIDGDEEAEDYSEPVQPKKSYLDPQNKILAGVCAGLAIRFGVPAFVLRLVFIALTALFGLGLALYLIFWISLDKANSRTKALAAKGETATARKIAEYDAPKENPFVQLQRIIFLPISLVGTLLSVIGTHFVNRRKGYWFLFKNAFAAGLLFAAFFVLVGVYVFNEGRLFPVVINWVLSAAALYIVVLILAIYFREFYLDQPKRKLDRKFKRAAIAPVILVGLAFAYLNYAHLNHAHEEVERKFALEGNELELVFNEGLPDLMNPYAFDVRYSVITHSGPANEVNMLISYDADGSTVAKAKENIQTIEYAFNFAGNKLTLDRSWSLDPDAYVRGQGVEVVLEIPQNTIVKSSRELYLSRYGDPYRYFAKDYGIVEGTYLAVGDNLYDYGPEQDGRVSNNERIVLQDKFCAEFFFGEVWSCSSNIQYNIEYNSRFDKAFEAHTAEINEIRQYLLPDRSLFVSNLAELNEKAKELSETYPVITEFQQHVEQLMAIKAKNPSTTANGESNRSR